MPVGSRPRILKLRRYKPMTYKHRHLHGQTRRPAARNVFWVGAAETRCMWRALWSANKLAEMRSALHGPKPPFALIRQRRRRRKSALLPWRNPRDRRGSTVGDAPSPVSSIAIPPPLTEISPLRSSHHQDKTAVGANKLCTSGKNPLHQIEPIMSQTSHQEAATATHPATAGGRITKRSSNAYAHL